MTPRAVMFALVACMCAALVVTAAPLLIYTLSLAAFGLPHVMTELRYVDERFGARLGRRLGLTIVILLGIIVGLRVLGLLGVEGIASPGLELGLVIGLAVVTWPALRATGSGGLSVGIGVVAFIGAGLLISPVATLVLLAVAHNLTPIGFLAEALDGARRRRTLGACVVAFGIIPLIIATGLPRQLAEAMLLSAPNASLMGSGSLVDHLGVFVPPHWRGRMFAVDMFSAAVYLQCLHYAVVIHGLPRLVPDDAAGVMKWPAQRVFTRIVATVGAVFFVYFCLSFGEARSVYGVFAAMHAWIEVPILLLALCGPLAVRSAAVRTT